MLCREVQFCHVRELSLHCTGLLLGRVSALHNVWTQLSACALSLLMQLSHFLAHPVLPPIFARLAGDTFVKVER